MKSARGAEARALDESVCVTPETVEGPRRIAPAGTAILWIGRRSSCVSPRRVFCTSSGLRISRALRMRALTYRTWTTPLSVIAATRSCGQATRPPPGVRRAMYSVSEIPSKRSSQTVLCQEHSLSASLCHVQHQRLIQSAVWTCALTVWMKQVAWFHVRAAVPLREIRLFGPV